MTSQPSPLSPSQLWVVLPDGQRFGPADEATLVRWAREGRVPAIASIESADGTRIRAVDHPWLGAIVGAPPTVQGSVAQAAVPTSGIEVLIPYRNSTALAAYYIGIFSLIPVLGLLLGPIALACGIYGLKAAAKDSSARGRVHAWIGIVLGTLVTLGHIAVIVVIVLNS